MNIAIRSIQFFGAAWIVCWGTYCAAMADEAPKYANPAIARAMAAMESAIPQAEADATRPVYHFRPPARYHNDPNGTIWHKGYYHLFYQSNPFGNGKGDAHWGHARSTDLVHWEHLPIAVWPSKELGERACASGCTLINPKGRAMIFYTSFGEKNPPAGAPDQYAALGDDDLIVWTKHPDNPVLTRHANQGIDIASWRDPFVVEEQGKYYMLLAGNLNGNKGGRGCIAAYQATNDDLTEWEFIRIFYEHPDPGTRSLECPNFFKFGDKWVLFFSHYPPPTQVMYLTGTLDTQSFRFEPEFQGKLEHGSMGMYAATAMRDPRGRVILWGWMRGVGWYPENGRGWAGCMTVPRILSLRPDGRLRQQPAPELQVLRSDHRSYSDLELNDAVRVLEGISSDTLEITAEFERGNAEAFGLQVRRSGNGRNAVVIRYDGREMHVTGTDPTGVFPDSNEEKQHSDFHMPFELLDDEQTLKLRVFIDRSALEIFANDRACFTCAIYSPAEDGGIAAFATGGSARLKSLDTWQLSSVW